jgi:nicotinamide phosphoribosyltransferase
LVVRPDSGDPVETPIRVILSLMKHFGYTENSKGYKVLPSYIRVIQGDGITVDSMKKILTVMESQRLSASNIAFGMGAGTLQLVNRDTYKFAMKCSAVEINGMWQDVWKEAPGKPSKRGRMTLVQDRVTKKFRTVGLNEPIGYDEFNVMNTVYHNHPIEEMYTSFENVRSEIARYV